MLSSRLKTAVGMVLSHRLVGALIARAYRDEIPFRSHVINTANHYVPRTAVALLRWGFYEKAEIEFIRRFLPPDLDIVELGASLGVVTLEIAARQEAAKRLVSVEANPHLIETIRTNVARNSHRTDVELINAAVDYSGQEEIPFVVSDNNLVSRVDASASSAVMVPAITLSSILERYAINEYALVCDIEGAEEGIIFSDAPALRRCTWLLIELHAMTCRGSTFSPEMFATELQSRHGFQQVATRGAVYVFSR